MLKIAVLCLVLGAVLGGPKANRWVGTWALDLAASRLAGNAPRKLAIEIAEADERMIRYTLAGTAADGSAFREAFAIPPDGRPHPILVDGERTSEASYRWTADGVLHGATGEPGGEPLTFTVELARDGGSLVERRHGKAAADEPDDVLVFRRQAGRSKG